jgi:hypothetical protein
VARSQTQTIDTSELWTIDSYDGTVTPTDAITLDARFA